MALFYHARQSRSPGLSIGYAKCWHHRARAPEAEGLAEFAHPVTWIIHDVHEIDSNTRHQRQRRERG